MQNIIELYITIAIESVGDLFDFRNRPTEDQQLFKAIKLELQPPKHQQPLYYFLHKNQNCRHPTVKIERRKTLSSDFNPHIANHERYKLLGGVKMSLNQNKIVISPIKAEDIPCQNESQNNNRSECKPYIIVRTFSRGYPIKAKQTLKLGNIELFVSEISQNNSESIKNKQTLRISPQEVKSQEEEKRQTCCRFCFQTSNEQDQKNPILSLCGCKGTSKYVHLNCLKQWLKTKQCFQQDPNSQIIDLPPQGIKHQFFCQICLQNYPRNIQIDKKIYSLFDIFNNDQTFLGIQNIQNLNWNHLIKKHLFKVSKDNLLTIGRNQSNIIDFRQNTVSRQHAVIEPDHKNRIVIRDLNSKFGTLLYDSHASITLCHKYRSFQIQNIVFSFKLIPLEDD